MTHTKKEPSAGPLLDKPRILLPEPGFISSFSFYAVLLLLGGLGAMGCFFTAFHIPVDPWAVAAAGAACALFCVVVFLLEKHVWLVSLSGLALWLAGVWLLFGDLLKGCLHTADLVLAAYGEKAAFPLPALETAPLAPADLSFVCTVFAVLLQFPFFWFLGWGLIRRKSPVAAFCLTGLFLLIPLAFSILPSFSMLGALLLFWLFLLLTASSLGQRHKLLEERGRFHASGAAAARPATLLLLPAALLCMALVYLAFPQDTYERPQVMADLRTGLTQGFGLPALFRGGTGSGNSRVDLSSLGDRNFSGETVLRVKYDWGNRDKSYSTGNLQKDYLKSFVGSVYTGGSWERLPGEDTRELQDLLGDRLPAQNLVSLLQNRLPSLSLDSGSTYHLSVENVSGNPRCVYAPYGLSTPGVNLEGMEYVGDGFLQSSRLFSGTPDYEMNAIGVPSSSVSYFDRQYMVYDDLAYASLIRSYYENATQEEMPESGFFSLEEEQAKSEALFQSAAPEDATLRGRDTWKAPDWVLEHLDERAKNFTRDLEIYNDFVYEHYTQLPEGLREELLGFLEEHGVTPGNKFQGTSYLTSRIQQIFQEEFQYSLTPPALPADQDSALYFLQESKEGFCVHFATAAAALFRAMGIPARYAEGYAVPSGKNGEWQDIPDSNAHAWVELYTGGSGWLPVEVTPAVAGAPAAFPNATEPDHLMPTPVPTGGASSGQVSSQPEASSSAPSSAPAESSAAPSSQPAGDTPGSAAGERESAWVVWLICSAAVLALLVLSLLLRRRLGLRKRKRAFAQRDRSKAALAAYGHLLLLYGQAQHLPSWKREKQDPPKELEPLALKARFSQHQLTQEELQQFFLPVSRMERKLNAELPLAHRLRCKYLLALF